MKNKTFLIMLLIASALTALIFLLFNYYQPNEIIEEITTIPLENSKPIPENTENIEITEITENKEIQNTSNLEIIEKNDDFYNQNGICSIHFSRTYPFISSTNENLALKLNEKINTIFSPQLFNNDNFDEADCDGESTEELSYQILKTNDKILSFEKSTYSYYAGAAHPNGYSSFHHIKLDDLSEINFLDVLKKNTLEKNREEILYLLILEKLNITYPDLINEWWLGDPENIINNETLFYLADNKLFIHFNPYDIAAYAVGPLEINFDLEEINEFLEAETLKLWE